MNRWIGVFVGIAVMWGCSSPSTTVDLGGIQDAVQDQVAGKDTLEIKFKTDIVDNRVAQEILSEVVDAASVDILQPQCDPGEGCFLDKCTENGQCQSGWCVEHMGDGVCTKVCQEECPQGWSCKQVGGDGPDVVWVCISNYANLCKPCADSGDCKSVGAAEDVCVTYGGEGSFCGGACEVDQDCTWGFSCVEQDDEGISKQCVADAGVCPCADKSIELALSTPCQQENDWGECAGERKCMPTGLSECDAVEPAEEVCNGIDEDCDGETDEPDLVDGDYLNLCDDANDCTDDKCTGEEGCVNDVLEIGDCSDDNPCTVADHCVEGTCLGDPVECQDDNTCTDNVCTETGGCEYPPNSEPCDDENACTLADQCMEGECKGTEVPCDCQVDEDCAELEDGDLCNGTLVCDTQELPYQCVVDPNSMVICPDPGGEDAFCLQGHCDPATGECSSVPNHEGFLCDNTDACTFDSTCAEGICAGGDQVNCNDGNACTDDSCEPVAGCVFADNAAACNDGDVCTTQDQCIDGECLGGPDLECSDGDVCNGIETCNPASGCVDGEPLVCDDGDPCSGVETCHPVAGCQAAVPLACDDGDACNGLESCESWIGCVDGVPPVCDDGDNCNGAETCDPVDGCQLGQALVCNDGNVCTDDSCESGVGCLYAANQTECDDGNACTDGDHCEAGACVFDGPKSCDDLDICTDNNCDPAVGCITTLNEATCDDGDVCTLADHCHLGGCIGGMELACDDNNACTDDSCKPALGCQFTFTDGPCDDGDECTQSDTCQVGACVGVEVQCNDGNICTDDSCDPQEGCLNAPNSAPCSDGNACTEEDICDLGSCESGIVAGCDDENPCTDDDCDVESGCQHSTLPDGAVCDEAGDWTCMGGVCLNCIYDCADKVCGEDGCGGSCGQCAPVESCQEGLCVPAHVWSLSLGGTLADVAHSVAVDADGNVVVAGEFTSAAMDMGCGSLQNSKLGFQDVFLAKFDPAGACLWSKAFGGKDMDMGRAVAVDHQGAIYLSGIYKATAIDFGGGPLPSTSSTDGFVAKFSSEGDHVWSKALDGASYTQAVSISVGSDGGVYAAGRFAGSWIDCGGGQVVNPSPSKKSAFALKLDSNGNHLWSKAFGGDGDDSANSIAVAPDGGVLLVGEFKSGTINFGGDDLVNADPGWNDVFIARLHSDGSHAWSSRFGGTEDDAVAAAAVDKDGNVFVDGYFNSPFVNLGGNDLINSQVGTPDLFVGKLDGTGSHLWSKTFGTSKKDEIYSIAADHTGAVYFCGYSQSQNLDFGGGPLPSMTMYVAKLDTDGEHVWSKGYAGGQLMDVVVDKHANVLLAGRFNSSGTDFGGGPLQNAGGGDALLVKLDQYGPDCQPHCAGKACGNDDCGGSCGECGQGEICFDGHCGTPPVHKWSVAFGGTGSDNSQSVAVDGDGNGYLLGYYSSQQMLLDDKIAENVGAYDMLLVKFDPVGEILWWHSFGGVASETPFSLSVDSSGNIYVVGDYYSDSIDFGKGGLDNVGKDDIFLAKFDSDGGTVWSRTFGAEGADRGRAIAVSPTGGFYVSGGFASTAIDLGGNPLINAGGSCGQGVCFDIFVAKYDSDGDHVWSRSMGGQGEDEGISVAVDSSDNVYLGGRFDSEQLSLNGEELVNAGKRDLVVLKLDSDGDSLWSRSYGGENDDNLYSLSVDSGGNVYVIGDFMSPTLDLGGAPLVNAGDQDIFVVKLDTNGDHVFSRAYGGTGRDNGYSVAVDISGMTYFTGYFGSQLIDFGGDPLVKSGDKDLYLTKLDADGDHVWSEKYGGTGDEWGWVVQSGPANDLWLSGCFRSPSIDFGGPPLAHANLGQGCDIFLVRLEQ